MNHNEHASHSETISILEKTLREVDPYASDSVVFYLPFATRLLSIFETQKIIQIGIGDSSFSLFLLLRNHENKIDSELFFIRNEGETFSSELEKLSSDFDVHFSDESCFDVSQFPESALGGKSIIFINTNSVGSGEIDLLPSSFWDLAADSVIMTFGAFSIEVDAILNDRAQEGGCSYFRLPSDVEDAASLAFLVPQNCLDGVGLDFFEAVLPPSVVKDTVLTHAVRTEHKKNLLQSEMPRARQRERDLENKVRDLEEENRALSDEVKRALASEQSQVFSRAEFLSLQYDFDALRTSELRELSETRSELEECQRLAKSLRAELAHERAENECLREDWGDIMSFAEGRHSFRSKLILTLVYPFLKPHLSDGERKRLKKTPRKLFKDAKHPAMKRIGRAAGLI